MHVQYVQVSLITGIDSVMGQQTISGIELLRQGVGRYIHTYIGRFGESDAKLRDLFGSLPRLVPPRPICNLTSSCSYTSYLLHRSTGSRKRHPRHRMQSVGEGAYCFSKGCMAGGLRWALRWARMLHASCFMLYRVRSANDIHTFFIVACVGFTTHLRNGRVQRCVCVCVCVCVRGIRYYYYYGVSSARAGDSSILGTG